MILAQGGAGWVLFTILGLIFGSFATAVSHRLPLGLPIARDRSRCPACGHPLGPADLVPVLSWLLAGGRCRHCGQPVSRRYPAIELLTAALFAAAWWRGGGDPLAALLLAATFLALVIVTVTDLEAGIIPNAVLIWLLPVAVAWRWHGGGDWPDGLGGSAAGILITWLARNGYKLLRGRPGMGLGDVKFLGVAGLYVGLWGLGEYLLIASLSGLVLGLLWRLTGRGQAFPFGPALCAALIVELLAPTVPVGLFG